MRHLCAPVYVAQKVGARLARCEVLLAPLPATTTHQRDARMTNAVENPELPATREAGLARLKAFVVSAGSAYERQRNLDQGPGQHTAVSGLAPYIRHRLVSETEVLAAVLEHHPPATASKFIDEVFWRAYWKGWLEHRPQVWTRYQNDLQAHLQPTRKAPAWRATYEQALAGQTGIEPFDHWVNELVTTGYLHNHARMWFASVWVFTLRLPWVLGADFFLRHLLDGDPASNTLSWRWVAGLQTQGKTYLTTQANLEKWAAERFFHDGPPAGLSRLAEEAEALVEAPLPPAAAPDLKDALPMLPGSGLLLTDEDLWLDEQCAPRAVTLWRTPPMHPLPCAEPVARFKSAAGADALARARQMWPEAAVSDPVQSVRGITEWVERHAIENLYVAYVPQGFYMPHLTALERALADKACVLHIFARAYDRLVWPHATHGFFRLRKRIPAFLATLFPLAPRTTAAATPVANQAGTPPAG